MSFKRVRQTAGEKSKAAQRPLMRNPVASSNQANLRRLQAKLTIGPVDDPLEHEADVTADRVMRMPATAAPPNVGSAGALRPQQKHADGAQAGAAPASVSAALQSPGQPLATGLKDFFEPRFGADFSNVRVHQDGAAGRSAQDIGASAYTAGQDLVFAPGAYAPESQTGRRLIAHELTHVLQQNGRGASIQRDTPAPAPAPAPAAAQASDPSVLDLAPDEDITTKNPKVIAFAASFQATLAAFPNAYLLVNAFYNSSAAFNPGNSPKDVLAAPAVARAAKTRAVLFALGTPAAAVTEHPADLNDDASKSGGTNGATQLVVVATPLDLKSMVSPAPIMPAAPAPLGAPAPTTTGAPALAPKPGAPASGGLPDFSKFTTIQIQTPRFSFALKIPSSIELKSKFVEGKISSTPGLGLKFKPVPGNPGVEIGLSGEITSLSSLVSPSTPAPGAPKATPPIKFSLSVGCNGKGFKLEARTEANLDNTNSALDNTPAANDATPSADHRGKITSGLYLTLIEPQVKYQIPSSVLNDINSNGASLQQAINSLLGTANPPQAEQPVGGPPAATPAAQSGTTAVMAIATAIAGIANAMDKIEKAKTQKVAPTTTIGIGVTDPIGAPGPGGGAGNQPVPFVAVKTTF
jgi:hypothetical protein